MDTGLLDILACPSCKGRLVLAASKRELVCRGERLGYAVHDGIPVLLVDEAREIPPGEELPE